MKRKRFQAEMLLLAEYLEQQYAECLCWQRVRLGPIPAELIRPDMSPVEIKMAGQWRKRAPGVVVQPKKVIIVKAVIKPEPGDIEYLRMYKRLFPETPEFSQYSGLRISLELVYAVNDQTILDQARRYKIRTVPFKPAWVDDYLQTLEPRKR